MKYPSVIQHSEEDCGAACLATIAKFYGRNFTLNHMREMVGTGQLGTTLLGLRRGAEALGFNAQAAKATAELLEHLEEVPLPAIIHWKGFHWIVLYGRKKKEYIVADPTVGIRFLNYRQLMEGWTDGVILLLEIDEPRFYAQPDDNLGGLERFLKRIIPYRNLLLEAFLLNFAVGLLSLTLPFLIQILTDDVLVRGDTQLLTLIVLGVIVMNLFSSIFELIQSTLVAHFAQRLQLGLVLEFGRQLLRLPLTYYESRRSGEITNRLQDIQQINNLISQVVVSIPGQFFIAIVSFFLMTFYSIKLSIFSLLMAIIMLLPGLLFLPQLTTKTYSVLVKKAENQSVLIETFKSAIALKTLNAAPQFWDEFQQRFGRVANLSFSRLKIAIFSIVFSRFVSEVGTISLLWFGSTLVIRKELTVGQLLAFNNLNQYVSFFMLTLVGLIEQYTPPKLQPKDFQKLSTQRQKFNQKNRKNLRP